MMEHYFMRLSQLSLFIFLMVDCQMSVKREDVAKLNLDDSVKTVMLNNQDDHPTIFEFTNPLITRDSTDHVYYSLQVNFMGLDTDGASPMLPAVTVKPSAEGQDENKSMYFVSPGTNWDFEEPTLTIPLSSSFGGYHIALQNQRSAKPVLVTLSVRSGANRELPINHPIVEVVAESSRTYSVKTTQGIPQASILLRTCQGALKSVRFGTDSQPKLLYSESAPEQAVLPVGHLLPGKVYKLVVEFKDSSDNAERVIKVGIVAVDQTQPVTNKLDSPISSVAKQADILKWDTPKTDAVQSGFVSKLLLSFDTDPLNLYFKRQCGFSKHRLTQLYPILKNPDEKGTFTPFLKSSAGRTTHQKYEFCLSTPIVQENYYVVDLGRELKQLIGESHPRSGKETPDHSEADAFLQNKAFYIKEVFFRRTKSLPKDLVVVDYPVHMRLSKVLLSSQLADNHKTLMVQHPGVFDTLLTSEPGAADHTEDGWVVFLLKCVLKLLVLVLLAGFFYYRCKARKSLEGFQTAVTLPGTQSKKVKTQSELVDYSMVAEA